MAAIISYLYGKTSDGKDVKYYIVENKRGARVVLSQLGASIVSILVPDKYGKMRDVVLGYRGVTEYEENDTYFGATVGRCCGRIQNGKFVLNDKEYNLPVNNGKNHLHGGFKSFSRRVWDSRVDGDDVVFTLNVSDGEEGYPGNMIVKARYSFDNENVLTINYSAVSDEDTLCNITGHSYFNLNGHTGGTIKEHSLQINADRYIPLDESLIPTGKIKAVANTPFDFRKDKKIASGLNKDDEQLQIAKGFDHSFVVNKEKSGLSLMATAFSEHSGIKMECFSTQPVLHLYTANYVDERHGKLNAFYEAYSGFCFETQGYPDAVNHPKFPTNILKANQKYNQTTKFVFTTV